MIGVFDSGIGGVTLLHELTKRLPHEDFIYYADFENVPYSYLEPEEILNHVEAAVLYLHNAGCKVIVLACNTATNVAISYLREKYSFPIIAIQPAIKVAADHSEDHKRILTAATPITLNSSRYQNLISSLNIGLRIDNVALPKLVEFAEKGIFEGLEVEAYLIEKMARFNKPNYHFVVLGCTHFVFYEKLMDRLFSNLKTVDGNAGTTRQLERVLLENGLNKTEGSGYIQFVESGKLSKNLKRFALLLSKLRS